MTSPKHQLDYCVIGSGPAGIACAMALLARHVKVTLLDVGITLPPATLKTLANYQNNPRARSQHFDQKKIHQMASQGIKLHYESDYLYQKPDFLQAEQQSDVNVTSSFALGGLSNVWGASLTEFTASELDRWPVNFRDFSPYYQRINQHIQPAMGDFGTTQKNHRHFKPSQQACYLYQKWQSNKQKLANNHLSFSPSILAINFQQCSYCASCMYGCPQDLIYSSRHDLKQLLNNPNFSYINQHIATRVTEHSDSLEIDCTTLANQTVKFSANKVFIACGPLETAKILINSSIADTATFLDSQYFSLPAIMLKRLKRVDQQPLHTLSQAYLSLDNDRAIMQLYTYMDFIDMELKKKFKKLSTCMNALRDRLTIFQGFLHSDDSPRIVLQKNKTKFYLAKHDNKNALIALKRHIKTLKSNTRSLGCLPIKSLVSIGKPGASKHYGGSFPMNHRMAKNTSDLYGRPNQSKHIHLVDASVFPTIPAKSPTLTIMANAYRIGTECEL